MIKVKRIDHVAVAVTAADRDAATERLAELFGLTRGAREHVATQRTDVAFLHPAATGGVLFELCARASGEAAS